jgi:hypothetical protein
MSIKGMLVLLKMYHMSVSVPSHVVELNRHLAIKYFHIAGRYGQTYYCWSCFHLTPHHSFKPLTLIRIETKNKLLNRRKLLDIFNSTPINVALTFKVSVSAGDMFLVASL